MFILLSVTDNLWNNVLDPGIKHKLANATRDVLPTVLNGASPWKSIPVFIPLKCSSHRHSTHYFSGILVYVTLFTWVFVRFAIYMEAKILHSSKITHKFRVYATYKFLSAVVSFWRILILICGVYVTCEFFMYTWRENFTYTWLVSFSRIRDLQVFHVYATCEFFAYTSLVSFSRIRDLLVFSRIRDFRVFHVYVTWEAYTDGRSRSLKSIYSPPRTFHSDRLFLSIMTTDIWFWNTVLRMPEATKKGIAWGEWN